MKERLSKEEYQKIGTLLFSYQKTSNEEQNEAMKLAAKLFSHAEALNEELDEAHEHCPFDCDGCHTDCDCKNCMSDEE